MALRIGFDMDGVLADFGRAYREVESRLFPERPDAPAFAGDNNRRSDDGEDRLADAAVVPDLATPPSEDASQARTRHASVWRAIEATQDFWTSLEPLDRTAVGRIRSLAMEHRWDVFFITQRPHTAGETVQRQTQRWLVTQGFDLPSVLVVERGRGAVAKALRLDYLVDDSYQNCMDVTADSPATKVILVAAAESPAAAARALGIGRAASIGDALDILERATRDIASPTLLKRLAAMVGWKT